MTSQFPLNDLQKLIPFVQAVRSGSFAGAAAVLHLTPSAVSRSIATLENEVGVRLFNRTTRRMDLTREGREFHARVTEALSTLSDAVGNLRGVAESPRGRIRVSVTPTFGRYALLPKIHVFTQRYPDVVLELRFDEEPPEFVEAGLDVRILQGRLQGRGTEHSLISRTLCEYPIVLVASPSYLARKGMPSSPADLVNHDTINIQSPVADVWDLYRVDGSPGRYQFRPTGPIIVGVQFDSGMIAALYGAGITPTSKLMAKDYVAAGRLCIVLPDYRVRGRHSASNLPQICVQIPRRKQMPAKVRVFLDFLYECFDTGTKGSRS